jgi:hypothetical protein
VHLFLKKLILLIPTRNSAATKTLSFTVQNERSIIISVNFLIRYAKLTIVTLEAATENSGNITDHQSITFNTIQTL